MDNSDDNETDLFINIYGNLEQPGVRSYIDNLLLSHAKIIEQECQTHVLGPVKFIQIKKSDDCPKYPDIYYIDGIYALGWLQAITNIFAQDAYNNYYILAVTSTAKSIKFRDFAKIINESNPYPFAPIIPGQDGWEVFKRSSE